MKNSISAILACVLAVAAPVAINAAGDDHTGHHVTQSDKVHQGKGLVESVDLAKGVVTMEHDPIESLRWPKMVMDFKAHDPALLKGLKEGDQVEFDLVKVGKEYHITRIVPAHSGEAAPKHDHTSNQHGGHRHHSAAGKPGKASAVKRTIDVVMLDTMRYEPSSITVKPGETVRFVVQNKGQLSHEFGIGTREEQMQHAEMMKTMPDMKHDDPNVVTVEPGQKKELIWQFTHAGTFEIACHVPGHYPAGMKMDVTSVK